MPAEKIRKEAICMEVNPSELQRISMNELPQMMQRSMNKAQMIKRLFFIQDGQRSELISKCEYDKVAFHHNYPLCQK